MLITEPPARLDDPRDRKLGAQEGAVQVELDHAPELLVRCLGHRAVGGGRATGVVVQDVELVEPGDGHGDRGRDAGMLGDIALDEVGIATAVASQSARRLGCGLTTLGIDLGDHHLGAFLGKTLGGRPANAATGAGDERHLAHQSRHVRLPG